MNPGKPRKPRGLSPRFPAWSPAGEKRSQCLPGSRDRGPACRAPKDVLSSRRSRVTPARRTARSAPTDTAASSPTAARTGSGRWAGRTRRLEGSTRPNRGANDVGLWACPWFNANIKKTIHTLDHVRTVSSAERLCIPKTESSVPAAATANSKHHGLPDHNPILKTECCPL